MNVDLVWLQGRFGRLSNLTPLSSGSFKEVFSATDGDHGDVVLKLIQPGQNIEDIKREILAVLRVQSPRVPVIYDHGTLQTQTGEAYWILEQRVIGETVYSILQRSTFDIPQLLKLGLNILEALVQAEEVDIVHRDIKPDNLVLDSNGEFWLIDFGLARHLQLESRTPTANPWGKGAIGYAPPEQFRNIKPLIDSRADLFALGVTIYECATGINPFKHNTRGPSEILQRVLNMPLPELIMNPSPPDEFKDLIKAMTQKMVYHRPQNVRLAYEWMGEICAEEGI